MAMEDRILISDLPIEFLHRLSPLLSSSDLLRLLNCGSSKLRSNLLKGGITELHEAAQGSVAAWKSRKTSPAEHILPLLPPGTLRAFSFDSCPMRTSCLLTLNTMHSGFESDWFCRKDWLPLLPDSLTFLRFGLFPFNNILSLTYAKYELEEDISSEEGTKDPLKFKVAPSLSERFPHLLVLIIDTQTAKHIYHQGTEEYTWDYNYGFRLEMPRTLTHLEIPLICVHASFCASLVELTQLETLKLFVSLKRRCTLLSSPIPHGPPIAWTSVFAALPRLRVFGLGRFLLCDSALREILQSVPSNRAQSLELKALSLNYRLMRAIPNGLTTLDVEVTCLDAETFNPRGGFFPPTLTTILMTVREVKDDMLDMFASKWTGGLPRGLRTMRVTPPWPTPTPLYPTLHLSQHCIQCLPPALEYLVLPFKVVWDANIYSFFDLEKRAALRALLPQLRHIICEEMPANEMRNLTSIESLVIEQRLEPPLFPHHFQPLSRLKILILGPATSSPLSIVSSIEGNVGTSRVKEVEEEEEGREKEIFERVSSPSLLSNSSATRNKNLIDDHHHMRSSSKGRRDPMATQPSFCHPSSARPKQTSSSSLGPSSSSLGPSSSSIGPSSSSLGPSSCPSSSSLGPSSPFGSLSSAPLRSSRGLSHLSSTTSSSSLSTDDFILQEAMIQALPSALEILVLPDLLGASLPLFLRCLYLYRPSPQLAFLLLRDPILHPLKHLELLDIRCVGRGEDDFFSSSSTASTSHGPYAPSSHSSPLDDSPCKNIPMRRSSDYIADISDYSNKVVESAHKRFRRHQSQRQVNGEANGNAMEGNEGGASSSVRSSVSRSGSGSGSGFGPGFGPGSGSGSGSGSSHHHSPSSSTPSSSTPSSSTPSSLCSTTLFPSLPSSLLVLRLPSISIPSLDDLLLLPPLLKEISFSTPHRPSTEASGKIKSIPFDNALSSLHDHPHAKSILHRLPASSIIHKLERVQCQGATMWCAAPLETKGSFFPPFLSLDTWIFDWHQHTHSEIELMYYTHFNVPWYLSR